MKRWNPSCIPSAPGALHIIALASLVAMLLFAPSADAQTRSARDTATAYGARLNAKGEPANLNPNRINARVNSRVETRLSLRVERYRPDSVNDPAAAFAVRQTDNARVGTDTTFSPLSTSASTLISQKYGGTSQATSSQDPPERTDDPTGPRRR